MIGTFRSANHRLRGSIRLLVRVLAFSMILVLLAVRLGSFSEEAFITPIEDAIFDVAFVSADEKGPQTKPQAVKSKRALECDVLHYDVPMPRPVLTTAVRPMHVPTFFPEEVAFEIFIPPEADV